MKKFETEMLDDNITSNVLKFVDDTKVFRKVNTDDKQCMESSTQVPTCSL